MDRRKRTARAVALMSLFTMTDIQQNVPVASFVGDGSDLVSLIVGIEPVQAGSGDPSPDNVRPISGWTECKVAMTGVNVWDEEWESGTYSMSTGAPTASAYNIRGKHRIRVLPHTNYYGNNLNIRWLYFDGNDNFISSEYGGNRVITTPNNCQYMRIFLGDSYGTTYKNDICINYPSTDHDYHAYSGNRYSITFPASAGTVYGGTLDVTTGKLTVDRAYIASYNGERLPSTWISDRDVYAVGTTPTTGAQVVYELAAPIVYDLTPTEINTLLGANNIWADTGEIKYIEYNV